MKRLKKIVTKWQKRDPVRVTKGKFYGIKYLFLGQQIRILVLSLPKISTIN